MRPYVMRCKREGVIPINHMFAIHQGISRTRPDVVWELFRMIVASRALAAPEITAALPPFGLEVIRKGLEMAIDWSYEQKSILRRMREDEPFDETTASLDV